MPEDDASQELKLMQAAANVRACVAEIEETVARGKLAAAEVVLLCSRGADPRKLAMAWEAFLCDLAMRLEDMPVEDLQLEDEDDASQYTSGVHDD